MDGINIVIVVTVYVLTMLASIHFLDSRCKTLIKAIKFILKNHPEVRKSLNTFEEIEGKLNLNI